MIQRYDVYGHCYYCGNGETNVHPDDSGEWMMFSDYEKEKEVIINSFMQEIERIVSSYFLNDVEEVKAMKQALLEIDLNKD